MTRFYVHFIIIITVALLAYSNTFNVPFHFDDIPNIVEKANLIKFDFSQNRSIGFLTFALNYKYNGLDVIGYHVVNLLIHVLNAILVYLIVIYTFSLPEVKGWPSNQSSKLVALFASLFFVAHPLQTQAVTYIVQRFASLAALFYLLALILYIRFRIENHLSLKSLIMYAFSLIAIVLAMKTKETAFTLPIIITLYEFIFFKDSIKRRLLFLTPLFLTMLIIPLSILDTEQLAGKIFKPHAVGSSQDIITFDAGMPFGDFIDDVRGATTLGTSLSRSTYLFTQFRVIVTYIRLLFLPVGQNLDYDYPVLDSFTNPLVLASFLFLLIFFGLGVFLLRHSSQSTRKDSSISYRTVAFGIFWFFITLSVESSIIPIVDVIFEHRVYLPSVGFFLAVVTAAFIFFQKIRTPQVRSIGIGFLVLLAVVCSILTYKRNIIWQSKRSLWEDVVKKSPNKLRGYNNLGNAYISKGLVDQAIEQYQTALKLKPDFYRSKHNYYYSEIRYNLALAYSSKGQIEKAIAQNQIAIMLNRGNIDAYNNLGVAYFDKGLTDKAIEYYQKALKLDPNHVNSFFNLGEAYGVKGLVEKSIEYYLIFLKYRPDYAEAHYNLGLAYKKKGLHAKADEHLNKAETLIERKPPNK